MNLHLSNKIEYRYIVAAIYSCVLFLDRLDLTIVNIILPSLAEYFHVPITQTEWITNSFLIALAISIPISAWLGDRFGIKKVFILATILFALSSLLCAYAPNIYAMIAFRFFQGIGGGIIIPVGMTMVYRVFDHSEYASITSFIFLPTLIAPALGPALGGAIVHFVNWQWVFLFVVPICFIAVIMSFYVLKEQKIVNPNGLDWIGFILSSCALTLLLYSISSLGKYGVNFNNILIFFLSIVIIYTFLQYEKNIKNPLFDIKYFKNELFAQANLIQLAFQICHFGSIFLIGMYFQIGIGMTALMSGVIMGMQALGAMCTSRYSVRLFNLYGPQLPITIGFLGVAVCTICILLINSVDLALYGCILLFIRGIFSGLCGTPIQTISVIGFQKEDVSRVSALFNVGRQVSISLGVALSSLFIGYGFNLHNLHLNQTTYKVGSSPFYYAFTLIFIIALIGLTFCSKLNSRSMLKIDRRI